MCQEGESIQVSLLVCSIPIPAGLWVFKVPDWGAPAQSMSAQVPERGISSREQKSELGRKGEKLWLVVMRTKQFHKLLEIKLGYQMRLIEKS